VTKPGKHDVLERLSNFNVTQKKQNTFVGDIHKVSYDKIYILSFENENDKMLTFKNICCCFVSETNFWSLSCTSIVTGIHSMFEIYHANI